MEEANTQSSWTTPRRLERQDWHLPLTGTQALIYLVSPDRPRTPDPLQPRHRPRKNLHPCPLQTHLSWPPSTYHPLDSRRLCRLLLHRPILRATNPMPTHSSSLGSYYPEPGLHSRKHDLHCHRLFQCPYWCRDVVHTDADPVATANFKGEEGAVDWHVHAWGLVSWPQTQIYI